MADAETAAASDDSEAPGDYICPITQELFRDTVITAGCGHTFERDNITEWSLSRALSVSLTRALYRSLSLSLSLSAELGVDFMAFPLRDAGRY